MFHVRVLKQSLNSALTCASLAARCLQNGFGLGQWVCAHSQKTLFWPPITNAMKNIVIVFTLCLGLAASSAAQKVMNFTEAQAQGYSFAELDKKYKSGMSSDLEQAVFGERQEDYLSAYYSFNEALMQHLKSNGLVWESPVRCFVRVYLNSEGKVDLFFYNFREGEVPAEDEARFAELVKTYIAHQAFGITANVPFSQCSPVVFTMN